MNQQISKPSIHLRHLLKSRFALSTVVTTLIILVISVLLASVVTYFAINVVSTRVQEESLHLTKQHIWHNSTAGAGSNGYSQASLMVINTGGRDIVIDKLAVRGQECDWNNTDGANNKFVLYSVTNNPVQSDMSYVADFNKTGINTVALGIDNYNFHVAGSDLVLKSGYTLLLYIVNPDSITINDIGLTVSITLYTAQAMYYREANVQAVEDITSGTVTPFSSEGENTPPSGPDLVFSRLNAWYDGGGNQVGMVLTNNGATALTVTGATVNGLTADWTGMYGVAGTFTVSQNLAYLSGGLTTGVQVQGQTLFVLMTGLSIPAGQTAIIWAAPTWSLGDEDGLSGTTYPSQVGQTITVSLSIQGQSDVSQTVQVVDIA